jgi:hypothetical protein
VYDAVKRKAMFNIIDGKSGFKVDFFILNSRRYQQMAFERRQWTEFLDMQIAVAANQDDSYHANTITQALQPAFGDVQSKMEKHWNYYWGADEHTKGSYALYSPGQWFTVRPVLAKSFIHTHFAGEHFADWQGFMEGAINTGRGG